jgi:hypothetical protein
MLRGQLTAAVAAVALTLGLPVAARADSFPLMGWWPMNEGSGQTVRDWSGHANNGTLGSTPGVDANDPSWIRGVFFGSALRFDGGDFVTIADSPSLSPANLTVAAWVRATGSPGILQYVLSKGSVACDHSSYGLYTARNGGLAFYIADANAYYRSPQAGPEIWDGAWHNAAGTFDGKSVRLYIDGKEVGTGTPAVTAIDYTTPAGGGLIGGYPGTCDNSMYLAGDIDGVQVWSQALPIDTIWRTLKSLFSLAR